MTLRLTIQIGTRPPLTEPVHRVWLDRKESGGAVQNLLHGVMFDYVAEPLTEWFASHGVEVVRATP